MRPLVLALGLAALLRSSFLLGGPACAQTAPAPSSITVQGEASVDVAPDAAQVDVGIDIERPTASAAMADVARAAQAVSEGIKADGIADKDVRTTTVGLSPVDPEDSRAAGGHARLPQSFRATVTILITVRPPDRAGIVVARLVERGATTVQGIAFTATEEARSRDMLRADAMRDARHRAEIYVQALGLHLGEVLTITPEEPGSLAPMAFTRAGKSVMAASSPALPVSPGPLQLREVVSVRWAIAP